MKCAELLVRLHDLDAQLSLSDVMCMSVRHQEF